MRLVIIESPYAGRVELNLAYARECLRDSLLRGEAPIASHLLYPQVLDDNLPEHRRMGIDVGLAWRQVAKCAVFYVDLGISPGMEEARSLYMRESFPFEYRRILNAR